MTCIAMLDPVETGFDSTIEIKMNYFARLNLVVLGSILQQKLK